MTTNCVFCKIINDIEKAEILFQDDDLIIFKDIKPAAKNHILVVPKVHIKNCWDLKAEHKELVEKLIAAGTKLFQDQGLDLEKDTLSGFHWPPFSTINHLHLHFINPISEMGFISSLIFKPNSFWFVKPAYVLDKLSKMQSSQ